eukprot:3536347-Pleurochrysis_carterae.AAC.1
MATMPTWSRGGGQRRRPSSPRRLPHSLREVRTCCAWVPGRAGRPGLIRVVSFAHGGDPGRTTAWEAQPSTHLGVA